MPPTREAVREGLKEQCIPLVERDGYSGTHTKYDVLTFHRTVGDVEQQVRISCSGYGGNTGRPVMAWGLPTQAAATWSSMRKKAGGFAAQTRQAAPSKRSGVLPQVATEVTDVQAREVH